MAKSTVGDWDTTAANNLDVGGITLNGASMTVSQIDNALREMMAQIKAGVPYRSGTAFVMAGTAAGPAQIDLYEDTDAGSNKVSLVAPAALGSDITLTLPSTTGTLVTTGSAYEIWGGAVSDETTAITTGTAKLSFSIPYAFTVIGVYATLNTASSSGTPTFDINEGGTSILGTKIVIDANEFTGGSAGYQGTASGAATISDASIAANAQITVDIDVAGTGAKGAKVILIGRPT